MNGNLSKLQIFNMVSDMLDDAELSSADADTKLARACRRWLPILRDQLLTEVPWTFARRRVVLAASAVAPEFGWDYAYPVPADCLRVFALNESGDFEGQQITFEVEANEAGQVVLLTNHTAPLYCRYIQRIENTGRFSIQFCTVLAARMARMIAPKITGKASYVDRLQAIEREALTAAKETNASQGTPERPIKDEWEIERMAGWQ